MTKNLGQGPKRIWEAWTRVAHRIGNFQARALVTILYVFLMVPFGVSVRLFADPLRIKKRPTQWLDHPDEAHDIHWAHRQ